MSQEEKNTTEEFQESNAARRLKATEKPEEPVYEEPIKVNKLANFWEYNRVKILIAAFFAVVFGIALGQLISRQSPDISILYAGPDYITPVNAEKFCDNVEALIEDYNGDRKEYVQIEDLVFMSDKQIEEYLALAQADDESAVVDKLTNSEVKERFTYEVFAGEAMILILAEDQYLDVKASGGLTPLSEVFDYVPEGAVDEYGIRFSELRFSKFYDSAKIFPADAVISLRGIPTASAFTGKKKAEKLHERYAEVFRTLIEWDYPEGYNPD